LPLQSDGLKLDVLAADPSTPVDGELWYNTSDGKFRLRRGTATKDISDRKINPSASAPPTVNNDSSEGYEQQSLWFDTTNNIVYICISAAVGAAMCTGVANDNAGAVSVFSSAAFGTTSTSPQNAFGASFIQPTQAGDWFIMFEGTVAGTNNNTASELSIGKNALVSEVGSERPVDVGSDRQSFTATIVLTGLVPTDEIYGLARREGGSGTVSLTNRRMTMFLIS
jgi:hypothetical protein